MTHTLMLRRHAGFDIEPGRATGLKPDHPALTEKRTIFPKSVMHPDDAPRLLVSGKNNPKLGFKVTKGPRAGWPIYHLTLEERATCPSSCTNWSTCYGNAMPYARRHDASDVLDLACALDTELARLQRLHRKGFLVRLHTLGDFFSLEYVRLWMHFIEEYPALHVFGYTANWTGADDPAERDVALLIKAMTDAAWDRFAIRFSTVAAVAQSAIVVESLEPRTNVLICPAQTKASECCATCGLCWAEVTKARSIGFLRHGMKSRGAARHGV